MTINRSVMFISAAVAIGVCSMALHPPASGNSAAQLAPTGLNASSDRSAQTDAELRLVAEIVESLRRIHTDSMDVDIPPAAKPMLRDLKHRLRDLIATLLRAEGKEAGTQQIEARVVEGLRRWGINLKEPECVLVDSNYIDKGYDYGEIHRISVKRVQDCLLNLMAVTTTIGVCCGEDTSFYLFKYEDGEWKLILANESNDYDDVSGAQALFDFGVSWPDENGDFFVVVANVNPWCSSNWQSLRYAVLRPSSTPDQPRVVLSEKHTIFLDDEPSFTLKVGVHGFWLHFHDEAYMELANEGVETDEDDPREKSALHYAIRGDRAILLRDIPATANF